jgi:hypothetical protein
MAIRCLRPPQPFQWLARGKSGPYVPRKPDRRQALDPTDAPTGFNRIVGFYTDTGAANHGFVRDPSGNISAIDAPGAGTIEVAGLGKRASARIQDFFMAPGLPKRRIP